LANWGKLEGPKIKNPKEEEEGQQSPAPIEERREKKKRRIGEKGDLFIKRGQITFAFQLARRPRFGSVVANWGRGKRRGQLGG